MQRAAKRRGTAPDRFEAENPDFIRITRCYRQIAAAEPERCVLIDANADLNTVAASIWTRCATVSSQTGAGNASEFGMSARKVEPEIAARHPRETTALFGHREAEAALLNAYPRTHSARPWLIGGAAGVGKATLAYRMARFVLAHRNPLAPMCNVPKRFTSNPIRSVARHIAAGAHAGLLTLERTLNDKGVLRTVITVDATRETISFFARPRQSKAGGSASSTPSTSSIPPPPTRS